MTAVVLHLSDIHIRSGKDWIIDKGENIAACVYALLAQTSTVFIVVSGDIAWSGKPEEYVEANALFSRIKGYIWAEREIPIHFVIAPGNHDCDFALDTNTRKLALSGIRNNPGMIDDSIINTACVLQSQFTEFAQKLHSADETRVGDKLWTSHRFTVEDKQLVFDALNVSWCSQINEEPGALVFPHERYTHYLNDLVDLRVSVIHHPLNWFNQSMYLPFKQMLRGLSNIIMSGHEHVGGIGEDLNAAAGHSAYIEGCVLQDEKQLDNSSFNVTELNLSEGTYRSTRYLWNTTAKRYSAADEGSWADFRSLPKKNRSRFTLTQPFLQMITDPGGVFNTLAGSPLKLADLYVYPDMQEPFQKVEVKQFLSTSILLDIGRLQGGVLLAGEEKIGATSLLFMLFSHFHDQGLLPIYVRGADIKAGTDKALMTAIRRSTIEQFGEQLLESCEQTPKLKKVLLLDDFDDCPVKSASHRAQLFNAIASRYTNFIVTVSEQFNYKEAITPHATGTLADLREFRLLPFGFTLRGHLVRRWFQRTADDGSVDEARLLAKCDQAERLLHAVMARNLVPALPLYLLTILQSIDAGVSGGFEESGLSEYYDFLVKQGLKTANVAKSSWSQIIEYCTHLAWQMHTTEHKEMSIEELRAFNGRFSTEEHRVTLDSRIEELERARILARNGNYFRFRYHYVYYFMKGRYLASRLADSNVQAYVRECCAHLYVRENANTILFLAHFAFHDKVFLECVVEAMNSPFRSLIPIEFQGNDTAPLAEFVRDLPKLTYTGEPPEIIRERSNQTRDAIDDGRDGLIDSKLDGAEHEFVPQLISVLKTVEILGQIIKNKMASVPRAKRVELLQLLMKGPLRVVNAFFDLFMQHKDLAEQMLIEQLAKKKALENDDQRRKLAGKVFAEMMQLISFGIIAKAVNSISSAALQEDIDAAAKVINSPAARLIAVGVRLDSPQDLSRHEIKNLLSEIKTDFIAARVLQMLTLRRLYMFRTTEQDKQWLDSQKILDMKTQQVVELKSRGKKLLKKH